MKNRETGERLLRTRISSGKRQTVHHNSRNPRAMHSSGAPEASSGGGGSHLK